MPHGRDNGQARDAPRLGEQVEWLIQSERESGTLTLVRFQYTGTFGVQNY